MRTWRTARADTSCKRNFFSNSKVNDEIVFLKPHFHSAHPKKNDWKAKGFLVWVNIYLDTVFEVQLWDNWEDSEPMVPYLINSYVTRVCPLSLKQHSLLLCFCFYAVTLCLCFSLSVSSFVFSYFWRIMLSCLRWWRRHECIYFAIWILRYWLNGVIFGCRLLILKRPLDLNTSIRSLVSGGFWNFKPVWKTLSSSSHCQSNVEVLNDSMIEEGKAFKTSLPCRWLFSL